MEHNFFISFFIISLLSSHYVCSFAWSFSIAAGGRAVSTSTSTSTTALACQYKTVTREEGRSQKPFKAESPSSPSILQERTCASWIEAKKSLQKDDCCVVSICTSEMQTNNLLSQLQDYFVHHVNAPADLDLRSRIRVNANSIVQDCLKIRRSVVYIPEYDHEEEEDKDCDNDHDPCTLAFVELAQGVSSLAEGPLLNETTCTDVYMRIVCASNYKAIDPMFHTDKAPLRGYVTLYGPGTEFCDKICSPLQYASLRTLGSSSSSTSENNPNASSNSNNNDTHPYLRQAAPLEFIVMKGDYYVYHDSELDDINSSSTARIIGNTEQFFTSLKKTLWTRTSACVHRSPPGVGGRRVIVSLDLADGDDDREWYQKNTKREWRSGMTQRKSRLVA